MMRMRLRGPPTGPVDAGSDIRRSPLRFAAPAPRATWVPVPDGRATCTAPAVSCVSSAKASAGTAGAGQDRAVADDFPLDEVNDVLGNVGRMVGNTLQVTDSGE